MVALVIGDVAIGRACYTAAGASRAATLSRAGRGCYDPGEAKEMAFSTNRRKADDA
jgi:hypothetical protein